mmetsp:Transcript_36235/g.71600  ORF Transcript_36235/g.71600 Transcript_36235/m.71600 type:complete len:409 (+) Transcript_36235:85-1311(+)
MEAKEQVCWEPAWKKHHGLLAALRIRINAMSPLPFRLHNGQDIEWTKSPNGSDEGLLRFLQARNGNVEHAATMFVQHLVWRRRVFPIHKQGRIAELLDESVPQKQRRFARIGTSSDGLPIIKQDMMWGHFVTGHFSTLDCIKAYLLYLEETMVMASAFLERQVVILSYGGFCPFDWGQTFASMLQDNYPERLVRACIWPVPGFLCKTVRTFCMLFCSKELNAKIAIESEEARLLKHICLQASQLPEYMQGGLSAIMERDKPDPALTRKLVMDAFRNRGRKCPELQMWPPPLCDAASPVQTVVAEATENVKSNTAGGSMMFCGCLARSNETSPLQRADMAELKSNSFSMDVDGDGARVNAAPNSQAPAQQNISIRLPTIIAFLSCLIWLLLRLRQQEASETTLMSLYHS